MAQVPSIPVWPPANRVAEQKAFPESRYSAEIIMDPAVASGMIRDLGECGLWTVFQAPDVLAAWTEHLARPSGVTWFAAVLRDVRTGLVKMILPLMLRREGGLRVIEGADLGVSDFIAPLVARGFAPTHEEMTRAWLDLRAKLPPADILRIQKMPLRIGCAKNPMLLLHNVNPMKLSNFKAALDADWEAWAEINIPERVRADLKARRRKLSKRGAIRFTMAGTEADKARCFEAMLAFRRERFAQLARRDVLDDPHYREFYWQLLSPAAGPPRAVMHALSIDAEIIATGYALVHDKAFHMIFPAFRSDGWRNYSPGLQLFLETMRWASVSGYTTYDFTIGAEAFKRDLGAEEYPLFEKLVALNRRGRRAVYLDRARRFIRRNPALAAMGRSVRLLRNGGRTNEA